MSNGLSNYQKKIKAQTVIDNLELDAELSDLRVKLEEKFAMAPPAAQEGVAREEVEGLVREIKTGTADNNKISRFLELAGKLGWSS